MDRPRIADEDNQVSGVAANMLGKQSRTADKKWSSSLGLGSGANKCKAVPLHATVALGGEEV
jgi:hypothetical protein